MKEHQRSFTRWLTAAALAAATIGLPAVIAAQDQRLSEDDSVNHITPAVARLANGDTVFAWTLTLGNSDVGTILARRFDATGAPIDAVPFTIPVEDAPHETVQLGADDQGGFVAVWHRFDNFDNEVEGLRGRIYGADGLPAGDSFVIQTFPNASQVHPSLAVRGDGFFVVVWETTVADGDSSGVAGRLFDADGNGIGPEFIVNAITEGRQDRPQVAMDAAGNFAAVWGTEGLFFRLFEADGTPRTGDIEIVPSVQVARRAHGLAMGDDGTFMVAYSVGALAGRIFDADGNDLTGELILSESPTFLKKRPSIAVDADNNFQVIWQDDGSDGSGDGIFTRAFDVDGNPLGPEIGLTRITASNQRFGAVDIGADGIPVFAWQGAFGARPDVFTRCDSLGSCIIFGDGFESGDVATWSSSFPP